ncbi:H-NS histone family protein [Xanthobacteraceae bacterium Astr-EGSB]|uniref:H-NS histone family protein n=1 Tax=Astrobacterium formosum TaxID=3069710 RepID=UPI0027B2097D|nr:H-NS histone family protein [Xanthobacteraceae bacterium Astr-EGSB]
MRLNLKAMSAVDLIDLRTQVDVILSKKVTAERKSLEDSLRKLDDAASGRKRRGPKASHLAGKKIAPKYRGPDGQTWTGRGLKPRWMAEALESGKHAEDFLIGSGRNKKGKSKRKPK